MNPTNSKQRKNPVSISYEIILSLLLFLSLFPFLSQAQVTQDISLSVVAQQCIDENLIDPSIACTTIYEPVCGCNGVTYPNECVAQNHYGVTEWTDGPCNNCNLEIDITSFEYTCLGADVCIGIFNGQAPFTISLYNTNTGTTTANDNLEVCFSDLLPGDYEVVIIDATGCSAVLMFSVPVIDYHVEAEVSDVSCFGGHDGAIDLWLPAGLPVWIEWTGPNGFFANTEDIDNLVAGIYTVQVTMIDGACYTTGTFELGQPDELHAEFIHTGSQCDGQVDGCLLIDGGTAPYHLWVFTCPNPQPVLPEPDFDNNGGVTVTGMTETDVIDVQPTPNGFYGNEICVEAIPAGIYYVIVADQNWCWDFIRIEIPEGNGLTLVGEMIDVSCHGGNDGAIELSIIGGVPPYTAYWVNENGETGEDFHHLTTGTYEVFVFDANQCSATATFTIHEPTKLDAEFHITSEACDAQVGGCLFIQGGTPEYRLWVFSCPNPLPTLPEPDFSTAVPTVDGMILTDDVDFPSVSVPGEMICAENIPPATYYILIADANNCWIFKTIVIEPATGIAVEGEVTHVTCAGSDGAINITVIGNYPPYFFEWSNGATTEDIDGLEPGVYTVQVYNETDFCTATATFIVEGFGALETNLSFDPYGSYACVDPVGGTEPYMIEWFDLNTGEPINNSDIYCVQGLAPGAYMVNMIDANGCEAGEIFFIEETPCAGGAAVVDPSEIESGDNTKFLLYNWSGAGLQWQFKTENTGWLNIPGATSEEYITPDIHTAVDKEIWVRAAVTCTSGDIVYSTEALLIVFGDPDLDFLYVAADRDLFSSETQQVEYTTQLSEAFPTITEAYVSVQFKAALENVTSVSVMDLSGKVYMDNDFKQVSAGQVERLDFTGFPSGIYLIRVQNERHVVTHKVFVERQ